MVSGPLADNLQGRLSLGTARQDGNVDRIFTGQKLGDNDDNYARASLLWQASDEVEVFLTADYVEEDEQGPGIVFGGINNFALFPIIAAGPGHDYSRFDAGPYTNSGTAPTASTLEV